MLKKCISITCNVFQTNQSIHLGGALLFLIRLQLSLVLISLSVYICSLPP